MRLFVAILLPQEIKEKIRDISRLFYKEKRNFKFTIPEQLHITLKFLGDDVSEDSLNLILRKLEQHKNELKNIDIKLGKVTFGFKSQYRPTVLSYLIEKSRELDELTNRINKLLRELDLSDMNKKKDRGTLIHHITIARARSSVNRNFKKKVVEILNRSTIKGGLFRAESLSLLESKLTNTGPVYKEVGKVKLS